VRKQNVAVQELPYPALREHLLAQKQALDLPCCPISRRSLDGDEPRSRRFPASCSTIRKPNSRARGLAPVVSKPHIGTGYLHDDRRGDGQSIATLPL